MLEMFRRKFSDKVTGDESWVQFFEPLQKIRNLVLATGYSNITWIAKRIMHAKRVMYATTGNFIFHGAAFQVSVCAEIQGSHCWFYKQKVLRKLNWLPT